MNTTNQLHNDSYYQTIFNTIANREVLYLPMDGNVGDDLIEVATLQLLQRHGVSHRILSDEELQSKQLLKPAEIILVSGGGNMGDYYVPPITARRQALEFNLPIVILPQTFINTNENLDSYHTIFVRDRKSKSMVPNSVLAPDMALNYHFDISTKPEKDTGVFLRVDSEALFPNFSISLGDPTLLCSNLTEYLALAANYSHIITDRLHFAIAALGQGNKATLLPNSYFKNRAMYETWLKDLGCCWCDSPDKI